MNARALALAAVCLGALTLACPSEPEQPAPKQADPPAKRAEAEAGAGDAEADEAESAESDTGDALSGDAAHVIPFADRTSMGYLLLLPQSRERPELPSRAFLQGLVQQRFPKRRRDGELDLLITLIETEPHATDFGTLDIDSLAQETGESGGSPAAAGEERDRVFDLIGLHLELVHLGVGEDTTIPASVLTDPVLTRALSPEQRDSLAGRSWALLLRADYRNQFGVRGLRLHQTLVRVVAEHFDALIHDPDTLETLDLETFEAKRLRASAGNIADQIAIVPFPDPKREGGLRLSTRGMRRFGCVDLELDGLDADPRQLQLASDLLAGLALVLAKDAEVDPSGFAVEVNEVIEVHGRDLRQSYSQQDYEPPLCTGCPGVAQVHLVERAPEDHDPRGHVVARVVAPRERSDAPTYDHPQWIRETLTAMFGSPPANE